MNIPNMITMARLFMTVLVFVCMQLAVSAEPLDVTLAWVAFWLFIVASVTDFLDGYLARKWNLVTAFGRIADPFADKILITGTLVMLLQFPAATEILTFWYVVIVIGREFLVTAIRGVMEASGQEFGADQLGKWKMVTQCWTVGALMLLICGVAWFEWPAIIGYWLSLALTVVSGLNYVAKARHVILKGGL
ncbi:MAG: CDP-diacylglycerol--glycerol-3-phosphate 3-phosphatidyltransferase [Planctomycetota bacterium]|jgi:CDP-diacylglycerol--glycerol-3-phosphate 3-phosphatidyltransferase